MLLRALESTVEGRKLGFAGPEGRYIVVSGAKAGVAVWDLLSCELVQTLPTLAADMVVALPTGILAARSFPPSGKGQQPKTDVVILSPSGTPGATITMRVLLSALAALPGPAIHLVGMAPSGEIYRFGELQKATAPSKRAIGAAAAPARRATSIWQEMFGRDAFLDELAPPPPADEPVVSALQRRAAGRPEAVFDGPSHTLPPVGMLFDAFMDELLAPRAEDEDAPMVVDEDDAPVMPSTLMVDAVRAVSDKEVAELEGFFRTLRASAPAKPSVGKAGKKRPNGLPLPNGHARAVSTPIKASKKDSRPATPATPDEPEVVDGMRKSKKRKAPRHSEA